MRKDELRTYISQQKRQFTPQQLMKLSLPVIDRLRPLLREAKVILAYYALPDEVDTHALLDELLAAGKTVLLPKVLDDEMMELRRYIGRHSLREGSFHIMEPTGAPFTDEAQIDIALIPGIAFDPQGHRLGRGKGYYDRFLARFNRKTIGVCFDFQKVAKVPVDAHDIAVDRVV
jgi:5-formyltetrahydrofolate cyclo-ligase